MKDDKAEPNSIEDYIKQFPTEVQVILQSLRHTIKDAAPEATEPAPTGIEAFKEELSKYKGAKGSVQFPIHEPMPLDLISKIVEFRVVENNKLPKKKAEKAKDYPTPEDYIKQQPPERQTALASLWQVIKTNLPTGFEEAIQYGMIGFVVPHSVYPQGYHVDQKEPLPFLGLANQKRHIALYHMGLYADKPLMDWFVASYEALNIGRLDMGKSCIRFKKMEQIPYDLVGELCTKMSVESYVHLYDINRSGKGQ